MRRSKPAPQREFFPGFKEVVEIGVGSLATVFQAREVGTNRLVALKLLNVRDASPRALESFERESIALGAVSSHPNIVTLYRSFRAADERPVLVLELCQGSVGDRMHAGAGLAAADVVALGIKIAGALETAHRAEILHRDVKPQNILITEFGEPALADFGVAMLQSSTQTTAGLFDFTTLHAAPELLEGGDTSAATDVYELASTLYQLIAGRAAFRAYEGESPASVILRILRDSVQPLMNTQAPASLSDLLLYAMSKDKSRRPPTAAEFAAELASIEVEQQWPRTQFLIRDAGGGTAGLPAIIRLPDASRRPVVPAATPLPAPTERVIVERQVIERLVFEPAPIADDAWSEVSIVRPHAIESQREPEDEPAGDPIDHAAQAEAQPAGVEPAEVAPAEPAPSQYPIPPSGASGPSEGTAGGAVPTWAFRAAAQGQAAPVSYDDIALDPMTLRDRVTLRAAGATMIVDEAGLAVRVRMRRSLIPWADVLGFEPRFDDGGRDAQLVVLTHSGPVELAATRRPAGEVRRIHALLDAYRLRAASGGPR